ncbi:hypothetical protein [Streptomyces sp. NPDC058695]|uniref:hypothetical protein n=1 Tax=Streptomyces sp. NPDC058695 TaxID=3346604 RepID=UPI003659E338
MNVSDVRSDKSSKVGRVLDFLFIDAEFGALPSPYAATRNIPRQRVCRPERARQPEGPPKLRKPAAAALDLETAMRM